MPVLIIFSSVLPRDFTCTYHFEAFISSAAPAKFPLLTCATSFLKFWRRVFPRLNIISTRTRCRMSDRAANLGKTALQSARESDRTTAIVIPVDLEQRIGGHESWWDVPVAEVSSLKTVQDARREYERARTAERHYLRRPGAHV